MSRDRNKPRVSNFIIRMIAEAEAKRPLESERRASTQAFGRDCCTQLLRQATFIEADQTSPAMVSFPDEADDPGGTRFHLSSLGYNFRRNRDNPIKVRDGQITMPADTFLRTVQRNGIPCAEIAAELGIQLPATPGGLGGTGHSI